MTAKAKTPIEVLKGLRESHAASFARTQEMLKSQKQEQQLITKALKEQPRSVPDVATTTGIASKQVLWWLAAMKKYGLVAEDGMQGDYPIYKLVEEK
jgi:predicted Rossmann fold nucleotide-binding protein DprA/Smf involved in DNA uptake